MGLLKSAVHVGPAATAVVSRDPRTWPALMSGSHRARNALIVQVCLRRPEPNPVSCNT